MTPTKVLIGQILVVLGVVTASLWLATQWTAASLGHQARLGLPWLELGGTPVFHPWRFFEWWFHFEAYAPDIFDRGGLVAGSGGLLGALAAIAGSVWRARQAKLVTTYGSARWATQADLKRAGLLRPAGVFLGRVEGRYLRHNGPEHVLVFGARRTASWRGGGR